MKMTDKQMHERAQALINQAKVRKILAKQALTLRDVKELQEMGHVATIYPRLQMVRVDGFKRYNLV